MTLTGSTRTREPVQPWGELMARPVCELEVACPLDHAGITLMFVARGDGLRVEQDGDALHIKDHFVFGPELELERIVDPAQAQLSSVLTVRPMPGGGDEDTSRLQLRIIQREDSLRFRARVARMLTRYTRVIARMGIVVDITPWHDQARDEFS
jgi:hypothetical protein